MKLRFLMIWLLVFAIAVPSCDSPQEIKAVKVVKDKEGFKLLVNNSDFFINGMNWDYFPIGTNYDYRLWDQPDAFIEAALDEEMSMLQEMGVNTVRQYTGVPAKWITYAYENYGVYTMLNHSFGRYGMEIEGQWVANTDYGDPRVQEILIGEVKRMVAEFKDTPGVLFFLLGNENNYGLFWEGAETEDIPEEDPKNEEKARDLYKLFNRATVAMKAIDDSHPIGICNGDLKYLQLIKEECTDMDIFGMNTYRGVSFGDAFQKLNNELGLPVVLTEFGADAFDAVNKSENEHWQAHYNLQNWKEIYMNAAKMDGADNALGGFTFQFSDGWWKYGQTKNLDVHDDNASWTNGGYSFDFTGENNNMNEEWFGICAKGPTQSNGTYKLMPRLSYHVLKEAHQIDPYTDGMSAKLIEQSISGIAEKWLENSASSE